MAVASQRPKITHTGATRDRVVAEAVSKQVALWSRMMSHRDPVIACETPVI
jgi:hypothetical protein